MTGSYYFKPMMVFYNRILAASTGWLMSTEGRCLIAKVLRHCRSYHGRGEAREFLDALYVVGCIYPVLRAQK